jgi:hypothetical protein
MKSGQLTSRLESKRDLTTIIYGRRDLFYFEALLPSVKCRRQRYAFVISGTGTTQNTAEL